MEMDCYEGLPVDPHSHQANIILKKKTYGGVPPGAGMRNDVIELFEELEEARNTLAQVVSLADGAVDGTSDGKSNISCDNVFIVKLYCLQLWNLIW